MFKVYSNLPPTIVADVFRARRKNYNLRHSSSFFYFLFFFPKPSVKTVYHRSESLSNLGSKIWNVVLTALKELDYVNFLRHKLKNGKLKTVHVCCVKRIYLMLDSYSFLWSFLTILLNLIILCYINIFNIL